MLWWPQLIPGTQSGPHALSPNWITMIWMNWNCPQLNRITRIYPQPPPPKEISFPVHFLCRPALTIYKYPPKKNTINIFCSEASNIEILQGYNSILIDFRYILLTRYNWIPCTSRSHSIWWVGGTQAGISLQQRVVEFDGNTCNATNLTPPNLKYIVGSVEGMISKWKHRHKDIHSNPKQNILCSLRLRQQCCQCLCFAPQIHFNHKQIFSNHKFRF